MFISRDVGGEIVVVLDAVHQHQRPFILVRKCFFWYSFYYWSPRQWTKYGCSTFQGWKLRKMWEMHDKQPVIEVAMIDVMDRTTDFGASRKIRHDC